MSSQKVLLTGYPGFLASEILSYFIERGARVDTLGLAQADNPSGRHFCCNLATGVPVLEKSYDLVIHAAGKAHVVPKSSLEAQAFFDVNVIGTEHLLQALLESPPHALVFISSVAVYGANIGERISETYPLKASDPYGKSKIEAEQRILNSFPGVEMVRGVVRLPLIAGPNAPGNLGSMFQAMRNGFYFNVGDGRARRSVILRSDVPKALEAVAQVGGIYNITDGRDLSFAELYRGVREHIKCPRRPGLPLGIAWVLGYVGESFQKITRKNFPFNRKRYLQMTCSLTFDGSRAIKNLGFKPKIVLETLGELCDTKNNYN